jgi:hypothetical protein
MEETSLNKDWNYQQVPIKIQIGDKVLFTYKLWLQVREIDLDDNTPPVSKLTPPSDSLHSNSQGFLVRSIRVVDEHPVLQKQQDYISYIPSQYLRYYIDMQQSFAEYKSKFSSKTRSTLNRKARKYTEYCGGSISWKVYKSVEEMPEFFQYARTVSKVTYQEKLLDAGLPDTNEFLHKMKLLAKQGHIRGFILFHQEKPVSYLYCPISNGILIYGFLGYDPNYMNYSVGTILQWLALEYLFQEGSFLFFDFTEGQSEHKKLFATHSVQCVNVLFLRRNLNNMFVLHSKKTVDIFSKLIGDILTRIGIKATVKRIIRFGK